MVGVALTISPTASSPTWAQACGQCHPASSSLTRPFFSKTPPRQASDPGLQAAVPTQRCWSAGAVRWDQLKLTFQDAARSYCSTFPLLGVRGQLRALRRCRLDLRQRKQYLADPTSQPALDSSYDTQQLICSKHRQQQAATDARQSRGLVA
ncbi:TPA: hypothetical protein ACH3X1_011260 [Trebouxia sp. C0004]